MKNTAKRVAALAAVQGLIPTPFMLESESLYTELEAKGFFWYPKDGAWRQEAKQTSEFELANGKPSDVFKIRLMAHPDVLPHLAKRIQIALQSYGSESITEVSEKTYPNRKGAGARVYMSGLMNQGK